MMRLSRLEQNLDQFCSEFCSMIEEDFEDAGNYDDVTRTRRDTSNDVTRLKTQNILSNFNNQLSCFHHRCTIFKSNLHLPNTTATSVPGQVAKVIYGRASVTTFSISSLVGWRGVMTRRKSNVKVA